MLNGVTLLSLSTSPLGAHPAYAATQKREELQNCIRQQQRLVAGMCAVFLLIAGLSLWALAYQAQPTGFKVKHSHPVSPASIPLMNGMVYESRHLGPRRIFRPSDLSPTLVGIMRQRQGTFGSQEQRLWEPEEVWACTESLPKCLHKTRARY